MDQTIYGSTLTAEIMNLKWKISNKVAQTRTSAPPHDGFIEPLDGRVNTYLESLVRSGCHRIEELQNRAKEFVVKNSAMFRYYFCSSRWKLKNNIAIIKLEIDSQKLIMNIFSIWMKVRSSWTIYIFLSDKYTLVEERTQKRQRRKPLKRKRFEINYQN